MRYFLSAVLIIVLCGVGVFFFAQKFYRSWERAIDAKVQSTMLEIEAESRGQAKKLAEAKEASLLFVGDIMLSRGVAYYTEKSGGDPRYPFLNVADELRAADLAFGNLEGPISERGKNQGSEYSFRAEPRMAESLTFTGFDVLSLANNHIMDWGGDALADTVVRLRANGIEPIGAGENYEEANRAYIADVKGTKIAFLAYTTLYPKSFSAKGARLPDGQGSASGGEAKNFPGVSSFELSRTAQEIRDLKESGAADVVVISFHWGEEYDTTANAAEKNIAHALADAGADLIVGHHPHVAQEVERYKNSWIAYSLGNFVFDQGFSEGTKRGLALSVILRGKRIAEVVSRQVLISETFQPSFPAEEGDM